MQTAASIAEIRAVLRTARAKGARIALVPTMGALHAGHLALVDTARQRATCVVLSVFVNPLQFAPNEDFASYPRDLARDTALARSRGVDIVFAPTETEMYPAPPVVSVSPVPASPGELPPDARWEGAARPGHFAGVLTVVAKLLNIVQPDVAVFGRKDLQQVTLVRAMVHDLNVPVEIVAVPTVRSADGLALSSRNAYLSPQQHSEALVIPRALDAMVSTWADLGETDATELIAVGRRVVDSAPGVSLEYLAIAEPERLLPLSRVAPGAMALMAARVGGTRLIDNIEFAPRPSAP